MITCIILYYIISYYIIILWPFHVVRTRSLKNPGSRNSGGVPLYEGVSPLWDRSRIRSKPLHLGGSVLFGQLNRCLILFYRTCTTRAMFFLLSIQKFYPHRSCLMFQRCPDYNRSRPPISQFLPRGYVFRNRDPEVLS